MNLTSCNIRAKGEGVNPIPLNYIKGWAIPIATDTAFVLGILSFFRRYISLELRAFIIGFSLIDAAVALIIIALFYVVKWDRANTLAFRRTL